MHHWAIGSDTTGVDTIQDAVAAWRVGFPDLHFAIDAIVTEGDLVTAQWTATGIFEGPLGESEPTGESFEATGINIFRFECGQIVEVWSEMDAIGMYRQLGLTSDLVATPAS